MDRSQFKDRANHSVIFHVATGADGYGDYLYGDPQPLMAYRHGKVTKVVTLTGTEEVSTLQLIVDGVIPITVGSYVEMEGKNYPVKQYSHFDGFIAGTGLTVMYL